MESQVKMAGNSKASSAGARGGWASALNEYIDNPSNPLVVYHDDDVVIIQDKFPKAEVHLLILPKLKIRNFAELNISHLPLLNIMKGHSKRMIEK